MTDDPASESKRPLPSPAPASGSLGRPNRRPPRWTGRGGVWMFRRRRRPKPITTPVRLRWLRMVWHILWPWIRRTLILVVLVMVFILVGHGIRTRYILPDLQPWHTLVLLSEYSAADSDRPKNLQEYKALEDRLFAELDSRIFLDPEARDSSTVGRFNPDSPPGIIARRSPYNRTQELEPLTSGPVRGGALLIHGLTDSPYSMRATAQALRESGFFVLLLRLPGHGTHPGALSQATAEDWKEAVHLGAAHVSSRLQPDQSFWIGGYSTGATLALIHTLEVQDDPPRGPGGRVPDRLLLLSPAIGVTEFAALSDVLASVAIIPLFQKASWYEILAEYDPHKYSSFPLNAGKQVYRLTKELDRRLKIQSAKTLFTAEEGLTLPPILSFQSLVDATVSPRAVAEQLFRRLGANGHEMVVFDLNPQSPWHNAYPAPTAAQRLTRVIGAPPFRYVITLVTSERGTPSGPRHGAMESDSADFSGRSGSEFQGRLGEARWAPGSSSYTTAPLDLVWPRGLISLSHVSIPFPEDDPIYGLRPAPIPGMEPWPPWPIGAASPRGERGAIPMDLQAFSRLRSNPFWPVVASRIRSEAERSTGSVATPGP
jgi:alpha-beta hydrolase superfamily lysophospholipase